MCCCCCCCCCFVRIATRVSAYTRGEREREEVFAVFVKFCVSKVFREAKSEEGQDRGLAASLSLEEQKPKKKEHRRLRKSSE